MVTVGKHQIHPRAILIIACMAQFMVVLDVTIVNIALPSMRRELNLSPADQQWIINAYVLVFGGFLLLGGRAADLYGRRRAFLFGLGLFSTASMVGGLASSGTVLIISRAVQGLGAAVLAPATLSSLTTTFAEGPARTRALTAWSTTAATGGAFGTFMGGILTDQLSWRWVLFVNVPIGIGLFVASWHYLHLAEDHGPRRSLDVPGSVTVTAGLATIIYAIVTTDAHPWGSLHTLGLLAIGFALLVAFVIIESRASEPLVPLRIFRSRALAGADAISFLLGGLIVGQIFFVSLFLQQVDGYRPLHAGLVMLLPSSAALVASLISGAIVARVGPRAILAIGPLLCAGASVWLSRAQPGDSFVWHIGIPLFICIMGTACCFVPMTMCATAGVAHRDAGLASGLLNSSRQIGGALFLGILATLAASETASILRASAHPATEVRRALATGYDRGLLLTGALALVIALIAAIVIPRLSSAPATATEPELELEAIALET